MYICSYMLLIIFFIKLNNITSPQAQMYTFKHYEIVRSEISPGLLRFNSKLISSTFRISEDISDLFKTTIVFNHGNCKVERFNAREAQMSPIYTGFVAAGLETITGYIDQGIFVGKINFYDKIFYVERAISHKISEKYRNLGILYNLENVNLKYVFTDGKPICERMGRESFLNISTSSTKYNNQLHFQPLNFKIPTGGYNYKTKQNVCSLELLVDHTFFEHMDYNRGRVVTELFYYAKIIDEIFRYTHYQRIHFIVEKITIFEQRDQPGYPFKVETNDSDKFLESLTEYSHNYCLLICFCHRDFWTEKRCAISKVTKIGAICQNNTEKLFSTGTRNHNVMFVTSLERNLTIPRFRIISNLLHQLGHAFNCQDDPKDNSFCRPGDWDTKFGNYIMHPNISHGGRRENWEFSSCCIKLMKEFMKLPEIENCLTRVERATCGNGIVEEGENCDCNELTDNCKKINKCCYPKGSHKECTLRETKQCSPEKGNCCNDNCDIITRRKRCFSNLLCFNKSTYCDGWSPFCPGEMEVDGSLCRNNHYGTGTCSKGECKSDVCRDNNLQPCQCIFRVNECHICCKNVTDECLPSKAFGLLLPSGEFYVKQPGTNCDNAYGICVRNGSCIQKPILRMYTIWHYLAPLPFVMFIAASIACYVTERQKARELEEKFYQERNLKYGGRRFKRRRKQKQLPK